MVHWPLVLLHFYVGCSMYRFITRDRFQIALPQTVATFGGALPGTPPNGYFTLHISFYVCFKGFSLEQRSMFSRTCQWTFLLFRAVRVPIYHISYMLHFWPVSDTNCSRVGRIQLMRLLSNVSRSHFINMHCRHNICNTPSFKLPTYLIQHNNSVLP